MRIEPAKHRLHGNEDNERNNPKKDKLDRHDSRDPKCFQDRHGVFLRCDAVNNSAHIAGARHSGSGVRFLYAGATSSMVTQSLLFTPFQPNEKQDDGPEEQRIEGNHIAHESQRVRKGPGRVIAENL